jgi:GT2 family glycosyltransferase
MVPDRTSKPHIDDSGDGVDQFRRNISVVVLNYRRLETTLKCLDSLSEAPSELIKEIIVVDNGSDPESVAALESRTDALVRVLALGINRYFGEGNNIGAEAARGEFVVFLNNALVQPGWIESLTSALRDDPSIAAVGPLFLYPDGRIQEVGGVVLPDGEVTHIGQGPPWPADHFTDPHSVDFCSAACLLVRTEDFLRIGGFGFEYEPAYYEDVDLCLKMALHFGPTVVNPRSPVVHLEGHPTTDESLQLDGILDLNRRKFVNVWGEWLSRRRGSGTALAEASGERSVPWGTELFPPPQPPLGTAQGTVVLYCPYELVPGGGERVMFELGAHLSQELDSTQVIVATPHPYSRVRIQQISRAFGITDFDVLPQRFDEIDKSNIELAVVLGNAIIPPVRAFGKRNVYICQFPFPVPDEHVDTHQAWLREYDEVWVYSDFVRRYVSGIANFYELEPPPIRIVYPPATWSEPESQVPWKDRRLILTVGRFFTGGHNKRQDIVIEAVRLLAENQQLPFSLAVVGALHASPESRQRYQELTEMAQGIDCHFYPNAGRQRLASLYANSAVLVHATGYGVNPLHYPDRLEHFGITPVECSSFGCIPVAYAEGGPAEVLPLLGCDTGFHTTSEAAEIISKLLRDPDASTALSRQLPSRASIFSAHAFRERVSEALVELSVPGPW